MHRLVLLLALAPALAAAQPGAPTDRPVTRLGQSEQLQSNAPGYFRHHLPGEATIQIQVEGTVVSPGLYEVADETGLREVLALSGGPRIDIRDRQSSRRVEIRLVRPGVGQIYAATLQDAAANPGVIPPLRHDDAVLVEVLDRRRFGWQDAATVVGAAGTVAFLFQLLGAN